VNINPILIIVKQTVKKTHEIEGEPERVLTPTTTYSRMLMNNKKPQPTGGVKSNL
jgi:hypothetical protein